MSDKEISTGQSESTVHKQVVDKVRKTACNVPSSYVKTTAILTTFFQILDSILELLQTDDVQTLIDRCESLMANNEINLFSNDQLML